MVLDAGHIAIESELAAKGTRQELDEKLNQIYNSEDFKILEKHMYDRFSITFEAAQVRAFFNGRIYPLFIWLILVSTGAKFEVVPSCIGALQ